MSTNLIKERPILFSGAMVRALLDGSKTQTRRVVKIDASHLYIDRPSYMGFCQWQFSWASVNISSKPASRPWVKCPYGQPGDRLWVRETFLHTGERPLAATGKPGYIYRAESNQFEGWDGMWKPSIFMPRAASRLLLEITAVRCERLQDISEGDALMEGVDMRKPAYYEMGSLMMIGEHNAGIEPFCKVLGARAQYAFLWNGINGSGAWEANPWVWVVEFKVIDGKEAVSA